ncbi:STAS/SEC14 domain-containing protein [Poriferisphaera sp. WC338]|uniref:STAS/SEC14 domain-containing protein n=1 Tax=Poriferisphaera sp. WC338 TaxID=3425129 RepID=UPI003D814350
MIDIVKRSGIDNTLGMYTAGKLTHDDYTRIIPVIEKMIEKHGRIRLVVNMEKYDGIELRALFDDLKFDIAHWRSYEKVAIVGHKKWQKQMTKISNLIMNGELRYFDQSDIEEAWIWAASIDAA